MFKKSAFVATAALAAAAFAPSASATTITFEEFAAGTIIDTEYAGLGLTISVDSNRAGADGYGVIFDTDAPTGGDDDLGATFDDLSTVGDDQYEPGNVIIVQEQDGSQTCDGLTCSPPDDEGQGGSIRFDWTSAVTINSFEYFDIEAGEAMMTVDLYDVLGVLITTLDFAGSGGDNTFALATLGVSGVGAMEVFFNSSGALDNINFDVSEVPLPGALLFMGTGLGVLGLRRKKKAA